MFKPLTRSAKKSPRANGGFAETQFLHTTGEDDYSGFAPTEMFGDDELAALSDPVAPATPEASGESGRFQPIISILKTLRRGLIASMILRQFSTVP